MEINRDELWTGWMTWEQIEPYQEQIVDMEHDSMVTWHYPDRDIPRRFTEERIISLRQHLANGNTWFWGAIYQGKLLGYRWAYVTAFINRRRWVGNSLVFIPEARGLGLGALAMKAEDEKARELGCDDMGTMYATFNHRSAHVHEKAGYRPCRIEVVKELKDAGGEIPIISSGGGVKFSPDWSDPHLRFPNCPFYSAEAETVHTVLPAA